MVGGLLEALGVDMGEDFKPGARANPLGFFEDRSFLVLNREILQAAGGDMYRPPDPEAILAQKETFQRIIRQLVEQKVSPCWGWKDPRTSLTMELFVESLPNPRFVVCRRDVSAIAKSLQARGDMSFDEGVELSSVYEDRIERFFSRYPQVPRLDIPYEEITRQPDLWIQKITAFLDLKPTAEARENARSLVLPRKSIRVLKIKRLLEKGLRRPWEIPRYVLRKVRKNAYLG